MERDSSIPDLLYRASSIYYEEESVHKKDGFTGFVDKKLQQLHLKKQIQINKTKQRRM